MRFFSPFPHGTVSLSVTQEYLALRGGPRRFTRDFTCPMLLGIHSFKLTGTVKQATRAKPPADANQAQITLFGLITNGPTVE